MQICNLWIVPKLKDPPKATEVTEKPEKSLLTKLNLNSRLYILSKANKLRGAAIKSSLTVPETTN